VVNSQFELCSLCFFRVKKTTTKGIKNTKEIEKHRDGVIYGWSILNLSFVLFDSLWLKKNYHKRHKEYKGNRKT